MSDADECYRRFRVLGEKYLGSLVCETTRLSFQRDAEAEVHRWYQEGGAFYDLRGEIIRTFQEAEVVVSVVNYYIHANVVRRDASRGFGEMALEPIPGSGTLVGGPGEEEKAEDNDPGHTGPAGPNDGGDAPCG